MQPRGPSLLLLPGLRLLARPHLSSSSTTQHLLLRLLQVRQRSGDHPYMDYANIEKLSQHIEIIVLFEASIKAHRFHLTYIFRFRLLCSSCASPGHASAEQRWWLSVWPDGQRSTG
jgi:hypothetical protein